MEKLKVIYRKIEDLIPYVNNARTHSEEQITRIASSIKEFGFTNPILTDGENGIIAGHGRLSAAKKLGMTEVPTIELAGLTKTQKKAYILADNKLALDAGWDDELLKIELEDLKLDGFDLDTIGFSENDLTEILGEEVDGTEEEEIPEPQENPVTKTGDVWILGSHRVMCGDSTSAEDVNSLVQDEKADFIHADPPYGMGKVSEGVENDNLYREKLVAFNLSWLRIWRPHSIEKINIAIWGNAEELWRLWYSGLNTLEKYISISNEIVWNKPNPAGRNYEECTRLVSSERCLLVQTGMRFANSNINSCDFPEEWRPLLSEMQEMAQKAGLTRKKLKELTGVDMWSHWFTTSQFQKIPEKHYEVLQRTFPQAFNKPWKDLSPFRKDDDFEKVYFSVPFNAYDVWTFYTPAGNDRPDHPTPKSLPLMEQMIEMCCPAEGLVFEPFGGSGQTLLAAEKTGRRCYTMELQPKYCDLIIQRWQDETGQEAVREDGVTFNSLRGES